MILTTTPGIDGRKIETYLGIVSGVGYLWSEGLQLFSNPRSIAAERRQVIARARNDALEELSSSAGELGADAIVGIQLDFELAGPQASVFLVTASGTAVKLG